MATARSYGSGDMSRHQKDLEAIISRLNEILSKMKTKASFTPSVQELDKFAEELIKYIDKHHEALTRSKEHIKAAIIDLTEIPLMHPDMQRIAIQTAVKTACENLNKVYKSY